MGKKAAPIKLTLSLLISIPLILISITHLSNLFKYPILRGFDAQGHIDYLNYLREHKILPLANQGWEFYQPPLYYLFVTLLPTNQNYRLVNLTALIIFGITIYKYLNNKTKVPLTFTALALSVPVLISLSPALSNELFSGITISVAFIYYIQNKRTLSNSRTYITLGILLSVALLSKATAWILVATIFTDSLLTHRKSPRQMYSLLPLATIVLLLSGWFYIRNYIYFNNPLITPADLPQFNFWQEPGHRDLNFFITLKGFINLDIFTSHWYSLLSGTYFSWFYDGHNNLLPIQNPSITGIIITLASIPLFLASLVGAIFNKTTSDASAKSIKIYCLFIFATYVIYNIKLPFYSTVKGYFLISLVFPFIFFLQKFSDRYPKFLTPLTMYIALYVIGISQHFLLD
jgi:hypothetical protein